MMRDAAVEAGAMATEWGAHADTMAGLKATLSVVATAIPADKPVVYLDYPIHPNVGDLLIHLGTEHFLADGGYDVLGRFSIYDFCLSDRPGRPRLDWKSAVEGLDEIVASGATIVMHGGGNLGDIYWNHQAFRDLVMRRYPNARIVMLPQSAHFCSADRRREVARLMAAHGSVKAFARDAETLAFLRDECEVEAVPAPDMAHALWNTSALPCPAAPDERTPLYLWRQDDEQGRGGESEPGGPGRHVDWEELVSSLDWFMVKAIAKVQTIGSPPRWALPGHLLWYPYRDILVRRALGLFPGVGTIFTDRLHGMILGSLIDRRVRFRDNSYGKLTRYHRMWLAGSDRVEEIA